MHYQQRAAIWVSSIRGGREEQPLTVEQECTYYEVLKPWIKRVAEVLDNYEDHLQLGREIGPVLETIDEMTEEQRRAWHELLSHMAALLASITMDLYAPHATRIEERGFSIDDVLSIVPVYFLVALSRWDPYRSTPHQDDFQQVPGYVRLSTWIFRYIRRPISDYIEQLISSVNFEARHYRRLRTKLRRRQARLEHQHASEVPLQCIDPSISPHEELYLKGQSVRSIHEEIDDGLRLEDVLSAAEDVNYEVATDLIDWIVRELATSDAQRLAAARLLFGQDRLSTQDRFALGL